MKKHAHRIAAAAGLLAALAFGSQTANAQMNMDMNMDMGQGNHSRQQHHSNTKAPLPQTAKTVFADYFKIQKALAQDSLQDVNANAAAIERAIRFDAGQTFASGKAGAAARSLAKDSDLSAARAAFQKLSGALIDYLDAHPDQAGHFVRVHCPMANADWVQRGAAIQNPYLGKAQAACGLIVTPGHSAPPGHGGI